MEWNYKMENLFHNDFNAIQLFIVRNLSVFYHSTCLRENSSESLKIYKLQNVFLYLSLNMFFHLSKIE